MSERGESRPSPRPQPPPPGSRPGDDPAAPSRAPGWWPDRAVDRHEQQEILDAPPAHGETTIAESPATAPLVNLEGGEAAPTRSASAEEIDRFVSWWTGAPG